MSSKTHILGYPLALILTLGIIIALGITLTLCGRRTSRGLQIGEKKDQSSDGIWTKTVNKEISFEESIVRVKPDSFSSFNLDEATLRAVLSKAPAEFSPEAQLAPVVITLPLPNNSFGRFQIEESSIMAPELAKRFSEIKSYKGRGLDDKTANVRFELTPEGLHAMVLSAAGDFLVDAVGWKQAGLYVSYFNSSLPADPGGPRCLAKPPRKESSVRKKKTLKKQSSYGKQRKEKSLKKESSDQYLQRQIKPLKNHASSATDDDSHLRIYRLAVATSRGYVEAIHQLNNPSGPSNNLVGEALAAIHRTINRVNLIYESEFGVRFVLVNDEPRIIFTNNQYNDDMNGDDLLVRNQRTLDDIIGSSNYDIGHLFIVSSGGLSNEHCACNSQLKARGLSGRRDPRGNAFDVKIVSHEIGHQLGASHSFNGTTEFCDESRVPETAYEPGSGSTIMGYSSATNVCGHETVQSICDPYFHAISLKQIHSYINDSRRGRGDSCSSKIASGNNSAPVVDAGRDHTIPKDTPFTLGPLVSSSDGDGDRLSFTWEEFDLGDPDPPRLGLADLQKKRPLFRSFMGDASAVRTFPLLAHLLVPPPAGTYTAEALPLNNRTMVFRVTARDRRGRFGFDDVRITIVATRSGADVGPFSLDQPQAGAVWRRGSNQTVRWSVARTNLAPINCHLVRISLLIRGDETHPILLADNVPNNGVATITLPGNVPLTTMGHVKIEAVNNIFFNVSGEFQITNP